MKQSNGSSAGIPQVWWRFAYTVCVSMALFGAATGPVSAATASTHAELLEAEKAFSVSARRVGDSDVELRYAIADGYYMYRDRFRFAINGQPVSFAKKAWPTGKWKQDATFGKVVTYRNSVRLLLPISLVAQAATPGARGPMTVTARSQGCADAGVCYPPIQQTLVLQPGSSAWVSPRVEAVSGFSRDRSTGSGLADRLTNGQ